MLWPWNTLKVTERGINGYSSMFSNHHAEFDIYHIYGVRDNRNVKPFAGLRLIIT